ncbi:MAG: hypothetical protein EP338_07810 [Bacteroidetes bacterium]|nr:MAG: hypothetical protein EP338_07810 [Bacteroidota bacterium]
MSKGLKGIGLLSLFLLSTLFMSCKKTVKCECTSLWNGNKTQIEITIDKKADHSEECDKKETVENGEKTNDCEEI